MFIRSERLFLRPGWPEDWEEILPLVGEEAIVRNLATAPWPYTAEDALEFAQRPQDRRFPHFLVTLPSARGPILVGSAGIGNDEGEAELGYWIAREHWGNGYATEAARAVLRTAAALGHKRVVAGHFADNPASGRVLRKAGFKPTGELRSRYSQGRHASDPMVGYAIDLDDSGDCGSADGEGKPVPMAA